VPPQAPLQPPPGCLHGRTMLVRPFRALQAGVPYV
jgi:hypothetical protein